MVDEAPLILTLVLDEASQRVLDDLRQAHFPAARNHLAAHVTMFHALPAASAGEVMDDVRAAARRPVFDVTVDGLRSLGGGVAFTLSSPVLADLRQELAAQWVEGLTRQDRAPYRPHVTVQNKVAPSEAAALLTALSADFAPWVAEAHGLAVWRYRGGPWEHVETASFRPR